MKLRTWRENEGKTRAEIGAEVDSNEVSIRRYELPPGRPDSRIPHRAMMIRFFILSQGAVQPNDFYDLPDLAALAAVPPSDGAPEGGVPRVPDTVRTGT